MENETKKIEEKIEEMSIYEKLSHIQCELKAPKNLYNKFGKYYYRNAETILESAKPICKKYHTSLIVNDEIVFVEGRFYVKAIAKLCDWKGYSISASAYAREEEKKTGMDGSQLTGSCSSYARKYALNGLFNIDDTKDADTDEQYEENNARTNSQAKVTKRQKKVAQPQDDTKAIEGLFTIIAKQQSELLGIGVDFREDKNVIDFVKEKANVKTLNLGETNYWNYGNLTRLKNVYGAILLKKGKGM